jgi:hypothetical protein
MINYTDNQILIDVSSSKRNNKNKPIFCVLCNNEKIQLECINPEENRYKCPRCKNTYQPNFEIFPQEDILESSHDEDDEDSIGLLVAEEEFSKEDNDKIFYTAQSNIKYII